MSLTSPSRSTLADVLAAITTAGLAERRRRDMASAVRAVVKALGHPADRIPADPRQLGIRLKSISPLALGMSGARWNNVRSLLRGALQLVAKVLPGCDKTPLSETWAALFSIIAPRRSERIKLSRLVHWLSGHQILPQAVTHADLEHFHQELLTVALLSDPEATWSDTVQAWNRSANAIPTWPQLKIQRVSRKVVYVMKWDEFAATDPFTEGGGTRNRHRPHSNRKVEKGYGRWLTFLKGRNLLHANVHPADRITLEEVKAYVAELQCLNNMKNSILCRLQELGEMARIISPDRDWNFINRLAAWVRAKKGAGRDKRLRLVGSDELYGLGLTLMFEAATLSTPRLKAMAHRDGLIIALLSLRPMRRRNFVALTIGEDLVRNGSGWAISIPGTATKNRVELEFDWPEQLLEPLGTYLNVHRPILAKLVNRWTAPVGNRLWVSSQGSPLTEMAFYNTIVKRSKAAFGKSVNPHLFRDAAATTTAIHDPDHVRLAAPLLGHRNFATTERYYQQAQSLEASRTYADMISKRRREPNLTERIQ